MVITLFNNQALEGEAEFCDFAAVTGSGNAEDFVAETEIAVLFTPVNLRGQGVDSAELVFFGFTLLFRKRETADTERSPREKTGYTEREISPRRARRTQSEITLRNSS